MQAAAEAVEQGHGVGLTAGLPGRYGDDNPAGQSAHGAWPHAPFTGPTPGGAARRCGLPTCRPGCGRRSRIRGGPWALRHPGPWCSPPGWTTAQSSPRHHCRTHRRQTNPSVLPINRVSVTETGSPVTSSRRGDLRRALESDVPPLWRSGTGREGACQSLQQVRVATQQAALRNHSDRPKADKRARGLTVSFLGFGHQLVVCLKGQQHGLPLCIVLQQNPLCVKAPLSHLHPTRRPTSTHIARGLRHGRTPLHRLRRAGSHGFRPAVVELARHRRLVATSRSAGDVSGQLRRRSPAMG